MNHKENQRERRPIVSVIMGVYNGEEYLREAVDSVIGQDAADWEFIIIDDCSTDGTGEILREYAERDRRIRVYRNETNQKLPATLNRALALARGKYVVRMDADDVCVKTRIGAQVEFMEKNPQISLSFGKILFLEETRAYPVSLSRRCDPEALKALLLFVNPVFHNAVIARTEDMRAVRYDADFSCAEDYDLWTRMAGMGFRIAAQPECMVFYRHHDCQVSSSRAARQREQHAKIARRFYRGTLFELSEEQLDFLVNGICFGETFDLKRFETFFLKILEANKKKRIFSESAIRYAAFEIIMRRKSPEDSAMALLKRQMQIVGPLFTLKEVLRRKRAFQRECLLWDQSARSQGMKKSGVIPGEKTPVYQINPDGDE